MQISKSAYLDSKTRASWRNMEQRWPVSKKIPAYLQKYWDACDAAEAAYVKATAPAADARRKALDRAKQAYDDARVEGTHDEGAS